MLLRNAERLAEPAGACTQQPIVVDTAAFIGRAADAATAGAIAQHAAASVDLHVILPDGRDGPAKVIGRDPKLDVALLSIDLPRVQALQLGDSDQLKVGEWVVVLGNPFGDEVTASAGIVSATGREAAGSLVASKAMGFRTFLQLDARVHRGNAGGPVVDTAGQVVGIDIVRAQFVRDPHLFQKAHRVGLHAAAPVT